MSRREIDWEKMTNIVHNELGRFGLSPNMRLAREISRGIQVAYEDERIFKEPVINTQAIFKQGITPDTNIPHRPGYKEPRLYIQLDEHEEIVDKWAKDFYSMRDRAVNAEQDVSQARDYAIRIGKENETLRQLWERFNKETKDIQEKVLQVLYPSKNAEAKKDPIPGRDI